MRHAIAFSLILIGIQTFAQIEIKKEPVLKSVQLEKRQNTVLKHVPIKKAERKTGNMMFLRPQFGDYKVDKYYILKTEVPAQQELNLIKGSLVKIQEKLISGNEISPRNIEFTDIQSMSRSEFITTVFGNEIRAQEPDIPEQLSIHRTNNEACFGIIQLDAETIALPYKGVLLILKKF